MVWWIHVLWQMNAFFVANNLDCTYVVKGRGLQKEVAPNVRVIIGRFSNWVSLSTALRGVCIGNIWVARTRNKSHERRIARSKSEVKGIKRPASSKRLVRNINIYRNFMHSCPLIYLYFGLDSWENIWENDWSPNYRLVVHAFHGFLWEPVNRDSKWELPTFQKEEPQISKTKRKKGKKEGLRLGW